MGFGFFLREKIGLGLSKQDLLEQVICEKAVKDFLVKNPNFDIRSHHYPFSSYSMYDVTNFRNKEKGIDSYILLHSNSYWTEDQITNQISRFIGNNSVTVFTSKFDPLNPFFSNIIDSEYVSIRKFN